MIERKRDREIVREIERDRHILRYRENVCSKQKELSRVGSSKTINYKTSQDAWLQLTSLFSLLIRSYGITKDNKNIFQN